MRRETTFTRFADRTEGGRRLAEALRHYRGKADAIVLALPRGGVVTGAAIADDLELPLDVLIVRKLGTPGHEELAMGAIGPGGVRVLNDDVVASLRIGSDRIEGETKREGMELARRERLYRANQPPLALAGKTVIVVDDGLATGSTMAAAIAVIRRHRPARVVLAVPVAPADTLKRFRLMADELVYIESPEPFLAVGYWYADFTQVEDAEVIAILEKARSRTNAAM
ncbi:MAG TPA: phosphoribosyltransferase [Thermoanaerobaculia bacterium]|nr:phosphoribosyltransferase [Thermoanaerobaculia bacterium]